MYRKHYPILFQFNDLEYRCIWYTDEKDGERFTPSWTDAELAGLKAVLEEGIKILRSAI